LKLVTRVVMGLAQAVSSMASSSARARRGERSKAGNTAPAGEEGAKVFMKNGYRELQFCSAAGRPLK
jgi:hypothetical protein